MNKLEKELKSFQPFWKGGTNRPKIGWSRMTRGGTVDEIMIYEDCIKEFVSSDSNVLEIGCGGGFWTQKFLCAKTFVGLDALSAEHNKFWDRVPKKDGFEYFQVSDFKCNELKDDSIDYLFSYDVFCHISYSGAREYLKNLYPKLKKGAQCFIMIADKNKYTDVNGLKRLMARTSHTNLQEFFDDYDGDPANGRWYFYGSERFCSLLDEYGYKIINKDSTKISDKLSPTIHFEK